MDIYDITIIGAGPAGLFASFYAGFREMRTKIIEALPEAGGQLTALYPDKFIYDTPGHPKILAKDLARLLWTQGTHFGPTVSLGECVQAIQPVEDGTWELRTDKGTHSTRTILITAGVGAFAPTKFPDPSVQQFEGRGVYYFIKDKLPFRGKRVLIVGGGDSAVDWALDLKDWATEVTLVHRRDQFRAHESSVAEMMHSNVKVKLFYELKAINGNGVVESATIFQNKTKAEETLEVDAVLFFLGFKADPGPIKNWGLEFEKNDIKVNGRMETHLPGVYAAGDIASVAGSVKLNLLATGFAQAVIAVNVAKTFIDPKAPMVPGHSSEKRL